jgi:hypothetical protein
MLVRTLASAITSIEENIKLYNLSLKKDNAFKTW